jgi:hypothetical protein
VSVSGRPGPRERAVRRYEPRSLDRGPGGGLDQRQRTGGNRAIRLPGAQHGVERVAQCVRVGERRGAGGGCCVGHAEPPRRRDVAQFVVVPDATVVAIALPAIRSGFGFSTAALGWVVTAYTLAFGGLSARGRAARLRGLSARGRAAGRPLRTAPRVRGC